MVASESVGIGPTRDFTCGKINGLVLERRHKGFLFGTNKKDTKRRKVWLLFASNDSKWGDRAEMHVLQLF